MRHYVLTRSAYGPAWDLDANRRRLEVTRLVTVAGMAAQTNRDWTWLVALDRSDPIREERKAVFASAGVEVRFLDVASESNKSRAAAEAYRADWNSLIGPRDEPVAMTRLDDDDAFAPWVMGRIIEMAPRMRKRSAMMMPYGLRVWDGRCTIVCHNSNAMQTLVTPAGDPMHVYSYKHREVSDYAEVHKIDRRIAWLWSRHGDTISGWHTANHPLSPKLRQIFPVDWSVFGEPKSTRGKMQGLQGRYFR